MEQNNIYNQIVCSFISLTVKFFKKSTMKELPNILLVYNIYALQEKGTTTVSSESISSMINDETMTTCIRKGLNYMKSFFKQLQGLGNGISVSGGSIEAYRMDNMKIDIISHDVKLHKSDEFEIEDVKCSIKDGTVHLKIIWPLSYLSEAYILSGTINEKKVAGSGRITITVTNFISKLDLKFLEKNDKLEIEDIQLTADYEDVKINISGLEVEENLNPEKIMNDALEKNKQKFKEMLQKNTKFLSEQAKIVLNLQLQHMNKKSVIDMIKSWNEL